MTAQRVAAAVGAVAGLALGALPAAAASPSPYGGYEQGAFLAYLNAPASGGALTEPPRLRISFGARSYDAVWTPVPPASWCRRTRYRTSSDCRRWGRAGSPIPAPAASWSVDG